MLSHNEVIAKSSAFMEVLQMAERVAESSANILIVGESGCGKEVVARLIHERGPRRSHPFVPLNCSAVPDSLLEAELFGYAKGSFTGAVTAKAGLFEEAEGGTLFLDEIADLDIGLQAKLLRVIQERTIKRVGENQYRPVNIRIICATHENLQESVRRKSFREDLFFRLNVIPIRIPPLRHRRDDIVPLAEYFLRKYAAKNNKNIGGLSGSAIEHLLTHSWPGNVRELENLIERSVILSEAGVEAVDLKVSKDENALEISELGLPTFLRKDEAGKILPIEVVTRLYIKYALEVNKGAKDKTARDLGIDRKALYRRLRSISADKP